MSVGRLLRSWLFVPGNSPRFLQRALETDADAVILDLEDSVPPGSKGEARALVAEAIGRFAGVSVWVRVNPVGSPWFADDIAAVVIRGLDGIRLPKVDGPAPVSTAAASLDDLEKLAGVERGRVRLVPGIESAAGVAAAYGVATASNRVQALAFGTADFCADIGVDIGWEATIAARSMIVLDSRRAGIAPPVDGAFIDLNDEAGLTRTTLAAGALGFYGRSAIHPRQVAVINAAFTPDAAQLERARAIVAAEADDTRGAFRMPSGEFVDAAIVRRARQVLELAGSGNGRDAADAD